MTSKLTIEFPSQEHVNAFTGWFSNVGEQDFYQQMDYEEAEDKHLYNVNFNNVGDNNIIVTEIEE